MKSQPRGEAPWQSALRTARDDGPVAASQAAMWHDIERAVLNVSAAPKAPASAGAAVGPVKAAFLGAALGSAISVSAVAILFHWGSPAKAPTRDYTALRPEAPMRTAVPATPVAPTMQSAPAGARAMAGDLGSSGVTVPSPTPRANAAVLPSAPVSPPPHVARAAHEHTEDPLSKEVQLLTGARDAIARGDAGEALAMLRVMRNMPSRQLAPEGLALEARALRVLGRDKDAEGIEAQLRAAPPEPRHAK